MLGTHKSCEATGDNVAGSSRHDRYNLNPQSKPRPGSGVGGLDVRRAKQGAFCQVKDLMFQDLANKGVRLRDAARTTSSPPAP